MPANESVVYYDHDFESSTTVNLLVELVTLVLIIFAGIYINYKRRKRDKRANETVPTSAEADKQIAPREKQRDGIGIEKYVVKEETDSAEGRIPRCSPSTRP